jgi:hypothetical protein
MVFTREYQLVSTAPDLIAVLRHARSSPAPFIAVDQEGGKVQRLTRNNGSAIFLGAERRADPSFASLEARFVFTRPWPRNWRRRASTSISVRWST